MWQLLTHDFVAALNTAHLGYPGCRTLSYFNAGDDDECIGLSDELDPRDRENTISTGKNNICTVCILNVLS